VPYNVIKSAVNAVLLNRRVSKQSILWSQDWLHTSSLALHMKYALVTVAVLMRKWGSVFWNPFFLLIDERNGAMGGDNESFPNYASRAFLVMQPSVLSLLCSCYVGNTSNQYGVPETAWVARKAGKLSRLYVSALTDKACCLSRHPSAYTMLTHKPSVRPVKVDGN
jgi:hypothetical protein